MNEESSSMGSHPKTLRGISAWKLFKMKWETSSLFRYVIVGGWNTLFSILFLYILFLSFSSKHYEIELGITFIISTGQSFVTQRFFVWKTEGLMRKEFVRFILGTSVQYVLNSISLFVLKRVAHFDPTYAALPLILFITSCFYFVNKHFVFKASKVILNTRST